MKPWVNVTRDPIEQTDKDQQRKVSTMQSMDDVRAVLAATIEDLRAERTSPAAVNAVSNAMGKYLNTYKLQIEYAAMLGEKHRIGALDESREQA